MGEFDNFDHLTQELGLQKRFKQEMEGANTDIEKNIAELESYLNRLDAATIAINADNEYKVRYECRVNENFHLNEKRTWLETELKDVRYKLSEGLYPEAFNYNLGALTELELIHLVKQMERILKKGFTRMEEYDKRMKEETKKFEILDEMRRASRTELKIVKQTSEKMKMQDLLEQQNTSTGQPSLYTGVTPGFGNFKSDLYSLDDLLTSSTAGG